MIAAGAGLGYPPGSVIPLPVHVLDFLPTFHSLAGGKERPPGIEGTDLSALWKAGERERGFEMMGYLVDHRYIRRDRWKLVSADGGPWELFNLSGDRSETDDLAGKNPEIAAGLAGDWELWFRSVSKAPFLDPSENEKGRARRAAAHMGDRGSGRRYTPSPMP
jgi:arylsulfatase